jgi:deazaflavin-dependent oxidoreductase (nitroreductase family)
MTPPRPVIEALWLAHRVIHRASGGRIGSRRPAVAGKLGTLFLASRGRRTGQIRRNGLFYLDDGRNFVVVASNAGADHDPSWWTNLQTTPQAEVVIGTSTTPVVARRATDDERARLWPRLVAANPSYAEYETAVERSIPVVILEPADPGPGG